MGDYKFFKFKHSMDRFSSMIKMHLQVIKIYFMNMTLWHI